MIKEETAEEIDVAAAAWAARMDDGGLSPEDRQRLDLWLDGDTRRLGAFARARAVAVHSYRAGALQAVSDVSCASSAPSRRAMLAAGLGGAVLVGAGLGAAWMRRSQTLETARGEVRTLHLEDGSAITLGTLSRISVRYGGDARRIVLMFGEVLFDVAEGQSRPFVVEAAGAVMSTYAGRFLLRRLHQLDLQVSALSGEARLRLRSSEEHLLRANHAVSLSPGRPVALETVDDGEADRRLAWVDGKLAFHDDALSEAAAAFSRYRGAPIVLGDARVAAMRITGLFDANDPGAFAKAVAASLDLHAEVGPQRILLTRA